MARHLLALFLAAAALAAADSPAEIMAKVADNMAKGAEARRQFVYHQRVKASLSQSNGRLNRREDRRYTVIPHETSTEKKLEQFSGEYRDGKKMVPYTEPQRRHRDEQDAASNDENTGSKDDKRDKAKKKESIGTGIDGALIESLVDDLVNDKKSPDGIPRDLFPLRADVLPNYTFTSLGEREWQGRRVLRIGFAPVERDLCVHIGDEQERSGCQPWQGEAWIDAAEFYPVRIDTKLARGIPWAVRTFLGTNIQQLGFTINYTRAELPNGAAAWFPATYGTEFKLAVLFLYKRTISLSLESSDFRRADTSSTIEFETAAAQ